MSRRLVRNTFSISVATTALASAMTVVSPPVQSATELRFTSAMCVRDSVNRWRIHCEATWEGGADQVTGRWSNGLYSEIGPGESDPVARRTWATGYCTPSSSFPSLPNSIYTVKITLTDAGGVSLARSVLGGCPLG
ncbi:hypothetical protein SMC26_29425 [Actinomadura fulvescens]|uniref:Secreted protein n=1 Tax=Actinomadura fulvescens TaxID=46160 RepID=A0ABP6CXS9_9ACTN